MENRKFIKEFKSKKIAVDANLSKLIECYGARCFDNGYKAYLIDGEINVFNRSSLMIDSWLFDVYFFKTGESFKKYMADVLWGFYDAKGNLICKARNVIPIDNCLAIIEDEEGRFVVYRLFDNSRPSQLMCSSRKNVVGVKVSDVSKTQVVIAFILVDGIEIKTANLFYYKPEASLNVKHFVSLFNQMYAISVDDVFNTSLVGEKVQVAKTDENKSFAICNAELKILYEDVKEVISLVNGTYFLKFDNEVKFCSKKGQIWARFRDVEVLECGEIWASFVKGKERELVGRFDEKFVCFNAGDKTIISDGIKEKPFSNVNFSDVIFI